MLYTPKAKSDNIFCIFGASEEYFANKIISLLVISHPLRSFAMRETMYSLRRSRIQMQTTLFYGR